jgi:hypothetical protein
MQDYSLERGGIVLGVITRGPSEGQQGEWRDWGWLEIAPGCEPMIDSLRQENRLFDALVQIETEGGDAASLLAEASQTQAEFMRPGVVLLSVADGNRVIVTEFHVAGERVYWRG